MGSILFFLYWLFFDSFTTSDKIVEKIMRGREVMKLLTIYTHILEVPEKKNISPLEKKSTNSHPYEILNGVKFQANSLILLRRLSSSPSDQGGRIIPVRSHQP